VVVGYLRSAKWIRAIALYACAGAVFGLTDRALGDWVHGWGLKPGVATAAAVNVVLPLVAVALGALYPRFATVWLGALGMTMAFLFGLAEAHPHVGQMNPLAVLRATPPVLIMACLGYGFLGTIAAMATRCVGEPQARAQQKALP
jgi:hypothetical protein